MTTAHQDYIAEALRDYVDPEADPLVDYNPKIADLRDILLTQAIGGQWITQVQTFLNAASVAAALTAIGLGAGDSPAFAAVTVDELTVATNALVVDADGQVGIGTAAPTVALEVAGAAKFTAAATFTGAVGVENAMSMTGSGRLIIGAATAPTVGGLAGAETLAVTGTGGGAAASISRYSNDTVGARLTLAHGRGAIGATTAVQNADELGSIRFAGASGGASPGEGAYIRAVVSGTPGTSAMPAYLDFGTSAAGEAAASSRMVLSAAGQLVVGYASAVAIGAVTPGIQNHGITQSLASMGQMIWSNDASGSVIRLAKSRGTSAGTHALVQSGDTLGQFGFWGSNGATFSQGAELRAVVDGTPSSTSMPAAFVISTTAVGATLATARVRVGADGLTSFGTTGYGFGSTEANALTAYANGTEAYRIDSSQRMVVGSPASVAAGPALGATTLQLHSANTAGSAGLSSVSWASSGFAGRLYFSRSKSGTVGTHSAVVSGDNLGQIVFSGSDGAAFQYGAFLQATVDGSPAGDMPTRLSLWTTPTGANTPSERLRVTAGGVVRPGADNTQTLGDGSFRWSTVFAGTGTINTSDARDKEILPGALPEGLYDAARTIATKFVAYKWKDAVNSKGWYGARNHIGVTAQEVQAALIAAGLSPADWAVWSEEPVVKTEIINDVEVEVPVKEADGVTPYKRMGLRHDQIAMLLIAAGLRRIEGLETRIAALEAA